MDQVNARPAGSIADMLAEASKLRQQDRDLAVASGEIVSKRISLGMAAAANPMQADHTEFARMVPEKVEAFAGAGQALVTQSKNAHQQLTQMLLCELETATAASMIMAGYMNPVTLAKAHASFMLSWCERMKHNYVEAGMMALDAHSAVMEPLRRTVAVNTSRLAK